MRCYRKHLALAVLGCLMVMMGVATPSSALDQDLGPVDALIKISGLVQLLDRLDQWSRSVDPTEGKQFSAMLRAMLQGTDWIDASRMVVGGVSQRGDTWGITVLVPYEKPNPQFKESYQASEGPNYYILTFPPATETVPAGIRERLLKASTGKSRTPVRITLSLGRLLDQAQPHVDKALETFAGTPSEPTMNQSPMGPEEARELAAGFMETARQLDVIELGFDLGERTAIIEFEGAAVPNTPLAKMLTATPSQVYLNGYTTDHHVRFRTQGGNMDEMLDFFIQKFGSIYKKMGMDPTEMIGLIKHFAGEMAGGMSIAKDGLAFEMISVLSPQSANADFIEKVYLPWMQNYSESIAQIIAKQTGQKPPTFYQRTADSVVKGYKVIGLKSQIPFDIPQDSEGKPTIQEKPLAMHTRLCVVDNLFLIAPNDQQMASLIEVATSAERQGVTGPAMTVQMDLGRYMQGLLDWLPESPPEDIPFEELGRMRTEGDWGDGTFSFTTTWDVNNFNKLVAGIKTAQRSQGGNATRAAAPALAPSVTPKQAPRPPRNPKLTPKDFGYWYAKGAICATYGNDKAAVRYFDKALAIDPDRNEAHFKRGISLGEMGRYTEAVQAINRALSLGGPRALYLYGRGRVQLLAGNIKKAMLDFREAAILGNKDAQRFMQENPIL